MCEKGGSKQGDGPHTEIDRVDVRTNDDQPSQETVKIIKLSKGVVY
jgi:hypothetical protein